MVTWLLVGAYRDNEVSPSYPLMRTLDVIHRVGASAQEIVLAPLVVDDVGRLVADSLHIAGKRAKSSTTYASALTYLVAGHALLAEDSWEQRYALTFTLEFQRAGLTSRVPPRSGPASFQVMPRSPAPCLFRSPTPKL